jgi:transcription initiation factor TFIIIB Brf1 subunit/transcription initiation factor TFIIB|tara:strand:+ start:1674 stop:2768 length:1095 start_codon:yes stop_codon:yes gene_type:complete
MDKQSIKQINKTKKIKKFKKNNIKDIWDLIEKENNSNTNLDCECIYEKDSIYTNNKCSICSSGLFYEPNGFIFCSNKKCGAFYKNIIDFNAEWRFYGADDNNNSDPTRCGMPINPLLQESSYGCKVMCNNTSTYEMRKIKRYTEWQSMPYKEKTRYDDFQLIVLIAKNSGIPKIIVDDAIRYYNKLSDAKTFRGLNRDGILAASIYISFSINKNPRTSKEIAHIFNLDNTSATKGCKNAMNILNDIEINTHVDNVTVMTKSVPSCFIERYSSKLNINQELTKLSLFIATIVENKNLIPENTPHSIAAGIIYYVTLCCNLNISKKDISSASKISEVTINKCYKKLENYKNILIPQTIINKYNNIL